MLFHHCSLYISNWMTRQPHVKEESLTDWLLFEISQNNPCIYYQAFSRHEEATNGADWEWWILTSDSPQNTYSFNAYRFLVQAKKLLDNTRDNYPGLSYANKSGLQIDLLTQKARNYNAFPLYMYYSTAEPDIKEQLNNLHFIDKSTLDWCASCQNGCFLSSAYDVYKLLFSSGRRKLFDTNLVNYSYKLSLLDIVFSYPCKEREHLLSIFNRKVIDYLQKESKSTLYYTSGVDGIRHYGNGIPDYLSIFVKQHNQEISWFESEMKYSLPDIDGLGVIDLRVEK